MKDKDMSKGVATKIEICGKTVGIGDYLEVRYTTGTRMKDGNIKGHVVELWDDSPVQARLSCGWCFHDHDEILIQKDAP